MALVLFFSAGTAWAGRAVTAPRYTITNVQVSNPSSALAHSEPDIVENPANPKNLVAGSKLFTDPQHYLFHIGTYYSMDGGRTWHDNGPLPGFDPNTFMRTSDISFAFSPNGSIVYACVLAHGPNDLPNGIYVSRSHDGGKTWSNPTTVFQDDTGQTFSDKPWITVDWSKTGSRATVYVAWNLDQEGADEEGGIQTGHLAGGHLGDALPMGIVVAKSTDYGKTFSAPAVLRPFTPGYGIDALGAIPAVGPDGRVYVAYIAWDDVKVNGKVQSVARMVVDESSNHGETWAHHTVVSPIDTLPNHLKNGNFRNYSMPSFAVSQKDSTLMLVWADMRFGEADILQVHSTNGGATWSSPVRVNHDVAGDGKDKFQPALAVAPNGTFTCAWFDRRWDPANRLIDEAIAQSTNDGKTFGRNIRVTTRSWDPTIDAPNDLNGSTFIGDYQGLAVDNQTVHPLWNDTQNGLSQEIRTAVISVKLFRLK